MPGGFFGTNVPRLHRLRRCGEGSGGGGDHRPGGVISVQVLDEATSVARRKMRLIWQETHEFLSLLRAMLTVQPMTVSTHDAGLALAKRTTLSIYDAMIVASVLDADCETLWSEDMQPGMLIDGRLRIVNSFRER